MLGNRLSLEYERDNSQIIVIKACMFSGAPVTQGEGQQSFYLQLATANHATAPEWEYLNRLKKPLTPSSFWTEPMTYVQRIRRISRPYWIRCGSEIIDQSHFFFRKPLTLFGKRSKTSLWFLQSCSPELNPAENI